MVQGDIFMEYRINQRTKDKISILGIGSGPFISGASGKAWVFR